MTPGKKPQLTAEVCRTCPNRLSLTEVSHGTRRCRQCRVNHPRPTVERKPEQPHTTSESVWMTADRAGFTERMATHFAVLGPGVQFYNAERVDKGGRRLLKRMRAGGL